MNSKSKLKKMIAPIIISLFVILYFIFYFVILVAVLDPILIIMLGVIPLFICGLMIYVLIERIKEIRSGEEDDLSKY